MHKILSFLDKCINYLATGFMLLLLTTVFLQVIFRYFFNAPFSWTEEVARYALVWLTFLGSYLGLRKGAHIGMQIIYDRLSEPMQKWCEIISMILIGTFSLFITRFGMEYSLKLMGNRPESFLMPMGLIYLILPIAGILYVIHCITRIITLLSNLKEPSQVVKDI